MIPTDIAAVEVLRREPTIRLAAGVALSPAIEGVFHRAPARIRAPAISFGKPQPMLVTGHRFTIVTAADGLIEASLYLNPHPDWPMLLDAQTAIRPAPGRPLLIAANAAWVNYSHWLFQCYAAALVADRAAPGGGFDILTPPLDGFRADAFALAGIAAGRLVPLGSGEVMLPARGFHTNLTDREFIPQPHPAILDALEAAGASVPASGLAGRRIYISRADSRNRRMTNEDTLCDVLAARGYDIVLLAGMPLAEQAALFRDAAVIVGPHGAGLTNLAFARRGGGPAVVELFQENFLNLAFLKIAQVKGLSYTVLINPLADIGDGRHGSTWTTDIDALLAILDAI